MKTSLEYINSKLCGIDSQPKVGIILGSGLGEIAEEINGVSIPYKDIPGFKTSSVPGHEGRLVIGKLGSKTIIAMQGRLHFYEGNSLNDVVYPIRIMKLLGIEKLIVTNAAGGINLDFVSGDLMLIEDHINLIGNNPLVGKNLDEFGPRFPDMTYAYDKSLLKLAQETAQEFNIIPRKGVYAAMSGPTYETPAEIRMLRILGADAVGMSTVPEVIAANHMGLKVLGISCITNMAAGILDQPLSHEEVIATSGKVKKYFKTLVKAVISKI